MSTNQVSDRRSEGAGKHIANDGTTSRIARGQCEDTKTGAAGDSCAPVAHTGQVRQVLLMVDYGPEHPESGNVYDLTAQVGALIGAYEPNDRFSTAYIALTLSATNGHRGQTMKLLFDGYAFDGKEHLHSQQSPQLADVVNMLAPPSDKVLMLKEGQEKAATALAKAEAAVTAARVEQLAGMRLANPVARLTTVGELMGNAQPLLTAP